jgi:hypothetical protein
MGSMAVLAAKAAEAIVTAATRYDSTKLLWRRLDFFMFFLSITSTRYVLHRSVGWLVRTRDAGCTAQSDQPREPAKPFRSILSDFVVG